MKKLPIFHVMFPNKLAMNLAIGRVSEYNENPVLAKTVFTWDELNAWWATTPHGQRKTFAEYWDGFNVPVDDFQPFLEGRFADLNDEERVLLKLIRRLPKDAYVIATADDRTDVLPHEVVHGLYRHLPAYRKEVDRAVRRAIRARSIPNVLAALARMGYGKQTFVDEVNAYLVTTVERGEKMYGPGEHALRRILRALLRKHLGFIFQGKEGERRAISLVHPLRFQRRA